MRTSIEKPDEPFDIAGCEYFPERLGMNGLECFENRLWSTFQQLSRCRTKAASISSVVRARKGATSLLTASVAASVASFVARLSAAFVKGVLNRFGEN